MHSNLKDYHNYGLTLHKMLLFKKHMRKHKKNKNKSKLQKLNKIKSQAQCFVNKTKFNINITPNKYNLMIGYMSSFTGVLTFCVTKYL